MNKICIIGRGNVATHLCKAIASRYDVLIVNPHNPEEWPADVHIYIIAVTDKAINEVSERLGDFLDKEARKLWRGDLQVASLTDTDSQVVSPTHSIVAHTSGSAGMDILAARHKNIGVFYPLQTFSKDVDMDYSHLPLFIEGSNDATFQKLSEVASFSDKVHYADSALRSKLHLAAVFACNFANHMWAIADEILHDADLDISILEPLISETFHKAMVSSPVKGQTGPAARRDFSVIAKHKAMLSSKPTLKALYYKISNSIINYGEAIPKSLPTKSPST